MRGSHTLLLEGVGAVDGYRLSLQGRNLSPHTIANYLHNVSQFLNWCKEHETDYHKVTRQEIRYYLGFYARDHAASTVYLSLSVLRNFYDYLTDEHEIDANPVKQVTWKLPPAKDAEPFTQEELVRMYQACQDFREQAVFLLIAGSGLRRGEVWGIQREDVNFETGTVTVTGKGQKVRQIRPGPETIEALKNALWFEERLVPFNSVEWVWWKIKDIAKRAMIRGRVYPHRFRHNFGRVWMERGAPEDLLMEIMGHASTTTTRRYTGSGRKQRALRTMEDLQMTQWLLGDGHQEVAG